MPPVAECALPDVLNIKSTSTLAARCAALLKQTWRLAPISPHSPNTAHRTIYLLSFHTGGLTLATLVLTCLSIAGTAKYTRCIAIHISQQSQHEWHDEHVGMY
jgi:hypothetical protein